MPRLPELTDREALSAAARKAYDHLVETRGGVSNSYAVMLHAPEVVERVAHLAGYLRFESSLDARTRELIALTTSVELGNGYEVAIHGPLAVRAGVDPAVVAALRDRAAPGEGDDATGSCIQWVRELLETRTLSDRAFAMARARMGAQGVVELVAAVGFYAMLALTHNALQVRVPD